MEVGEHDHSEGPKVDGVLDQVHQFVHAFGVDWTVHHDFLSLTEVKDIKVEVEKVMLFVLLGMWRVDEVVSDFDHVVVKVNMTINKGVESRHKSSMQITVQTNMLKDYSIFLKIENCDFEILALSELGHL